MIEAVAIAHAIGEQEKDRRSESLFNSGQYKSPIIARKTQLKDLDNKQSSFYIREKIEIGVVA